MIPLTQSPIRPKSDLRDMLRQYIVIIGSSQRVQPGCQPGDIFSG